MTDFVSVYSKSFERKEANTIEAPLNAAEREELLWRRLSDKVSEDVDKQIKRRYFWAAILFAVFSWFGGAALINGIVQLHVGDKLAEATVRAQRAAEEATETQKALAPMQRALKEAETAQKGLRDSNVDLASRQKSLTEQLESAGAIASTLDQLDKRLRTLEAAVAELSSRVGGISTTIPSKRPAATVFVRFGGNISADEASAFTRELSKSGQYAVTGEGRPFVGATSLRYFYDEDQSAAEQLARDAADALRKLNIPDRTISLVPLTGRALKPPRGTFELWLNLQSR
jgi:hypothetical protein